MLYSGLEISRKSRKSKKSLKYNQLSQEISLNTQTQKPSEKSKEENNRHSLKQPKSQFSEVLQDLSKSSYEIESLSIRSSQNMHKSSENIISDSLLQNYKLTEASIHYNITCFSEVARVLKKNPDYLSIPTYESYVKHGPFITEADKNSSKRWIHNMKLPNGSIYSGEITTQNAVQGKGIVIKQDKSIFEGVFVEGRVRGYGRFIDSAGIIYQGVFKGRYLDKEGTIHSKDGDQIYIGEVLDNQPQGKGKETWRNGSIFIGTFRKGQRHGYGEFLWADKSTYHGNFRKHRIEGFGIYTWRDGRKYEGYWKNNKINGAGIFYWPDGKIYKGEFHKGKKDGFGVLEYENKNWYIGQWENNQKHGYGVEFKFEDVGSLTVGVWDEGDLKVIHKQKRDLSRKQVKKYKKRAVRDLLPDNKKLKKLWRRNEMTESLVESKRELESERSFNKELSELEDSIEKEINRSHTNSRNEYSKEQDPLLNYSFIIEDEVKPNLYYESNDTFEDQSARSIKTENIKKTLIQSPQNISNFHTLNKSPDSPPDTSSTYKSQGKTESNPFLTVSIGNILQQGVRKLEQTSSFPVPEEKRIKELSEIVHIMKKFKQLTAAIKVRLSLGPFEYLNSDISHLEWSEWFPLIDFLFYTGEILNGSIHGRGVLISPEYIYEGPWENHQKQGIGRQILSNGDVYEGAWNKDIRHGFGVLWKNSGEGYIGDWEHDLPHGKGTEITTHVVYEGDFVKGAKIGKGKFIYKDGSYYEGEINHDAPHGYGFLVCSDGKGYVGQWKKGEMKGKGTIIQKDIKIIHSEMFYIPQIHLQYINPEDEQTFHDLEHKHVSNIQQNAQVEHHFAEEISLLHSEPFIAIQEANNFDYRSLELSQDSKLDLIQSEYKYDISEAFKKPIPNEEYQYISLKQADHSTNIANTHQIPSKKLVGKSNSTIISRKLSKSPTISKNLSKSPTIAKNLSKSPTISKNLSKSPTIAKNPSKSPTISKNLSKSPTISKTLSKSPTIAKTLSKSPTISKNLSKSPTIAKNLSNSPTISKKLSRSPNIMT